MRRILLAAAILASVLAPAPCAPAEVRAAMAAGPVLEPSAPPGEPEARLAPERIRRRAGRCARAALADLARRADFAVFAPRALPAGWVPAVCVHPPDGRRVHGLRIHFHAAYAPLPSAGVLEPRIAGIAQTKASLPGLSDKHGRPVRLRGRTARFRPWPPGVLEADGRPVHGGTLRWIERGTLIEIDSRVLTLKQMVRLAESLAPVAREPSAGHRAAPTAPHAGTVKPQLPILPGESILGLRGPDRTWSGRGLGSREGSG